MNHHETNLDDKMDTGFKEIILGNENIWVKTEQSAMFSNAPTPDVSQYIGLNTELKEPIIVRKEISMKQTVSPKSKSPKTIKKEWQIGYVHKRYKKLGLDQKENMVVELIKLGFSKEKVQATVFRSNVKTLEEAMDYMVRYKDEKWAHKFLSYREIQKQFEEERYCSLCKYKQTNKEPVKMQGNQKIFPAEVQTINYVKNGLAMKNKQYYKEVSIKEKSKGMFLSIMESGNMSEVSRDDKEDTCFFCRDYLEEHSVDYNIDSLLFEFNDPVPITQFIKLKEDQNEIKNEDPVCAICFESELVDAVPVNLLCGHVLCSLCLRSYVTLAMSNKQSQSIKCPVDQCFKEISDKIIQSLAPSKRHWKRYVSRRTEISNIKAHRLIYCPRCTDTIILGNKAAEPSIVVCEECGVGICTLCHRQSHANRTCAEDLSMKYSKIVRGWKWQTCPNCKEGVKFAFQCQHMTCKSCYTSFCIYCRKTECKNFACNPLTSSTPFGFSDNKAICKMIILCLLIVLLSPLLALFFVPYLAASNVYDHFNEKEKYMRSAKSLRESMYLSTISNTTVHTNFMKPKDSEILIYNNNNSCYTCFMIVLVVLLAVILSPLSLVAIIIISVVGAIYYIIN